MNPENRKSDKNLRKRESTNEWKITMGMRPVEKNLKQTNSGKIDLEKRLSGEKISRKMNPEETVARGAFR
ncbi:MULTISPECIES: hypothetical protein [unclassified Methanosarcina]|uniref:hypothetical protein n=1 Tax=unclassified Methanosarcina TaxID=2644672 RepID=UPI00064E69F1|nr:MULTISPECIES: hypothetical protein [unclassified Methanosarcina]